MHGEPEGSEQIPGGQDDAGGGEPGERRGGVEDANQDGEFADEAVEAGQSDGREHNDEEKAAEDRYLLPKPAEIAHDAGVQTFVEHPDGEKEGAGAEAVIDHLQDGAGNALRGEAEDAEDDEAEMGDGGVGDEALDVTLAQGDESAVQNADEGKSRQIGGEDGGGLGEER